MCPKKVTKPLKLEADVLVRSHTISKSTVKLVKSKKNHKGKEDETQEGPVTPSSL